MDNKQLLTCVNKAIAYLSERYGLSAKQIHAYLINTLGNIAPSKRQIVLFLRRSLNKDTAEKSLHGLKINIGDENKIYTDNKICWANYSKFKRKASSVRRLRRCQCSVHRIKKKKPRCRPKPKCKQRTIKCRCGRKIVIRRKSKCRQYKPRTVKRCCRKKIQRCRRKYKPRTVKRCCRKKIQRCRRKKPKVTRCRCCGKKISSRKRNCPKKRKPRPCKRKPRPCKRKIKKICRCRTIRAKFKAGKLTTRKCPKHGSVLKPDYKVKVRMKKGGFEVNIKRRNTRIKTFRFKCKDKPKKKPKKRTRVLKCRCQKPVKKTSPTKTDIRCGCGPTE